MRLHDAPHAAIDTMQDSTAQTQDSIVQVRGLKNAAYLKYTAPPP